MSDKLFPELTWEILVDQRPSNLVVDTLHGYAIIKDRLDSYWQIVRNTPPGEDKDAMLLTALAGIAVAAQLTAECLGFVNEQGTHEEIESEAKQDVETARQIFERLIHEIGGKSKRTTSHQIGNPLFSFEFTPQWFRVLQDRTGVDFNPRAKHDGII